MYTAIQDSFLKVLPLIRSYIEEFDDHNTIIQLAQLYPKAHAYWLSLLFSMDLISPENCQLCFSGTYSRLFIRLLFYFYQNSFSHTKSLITILLTHKMFDDKTDKKKISEIWLKAPPEYCVRLLKMPSSKDIESFLKYYACQKSYLKSFRHVPIPVLESIVQKQKEELSNGDKIVTNPVLTL